MSFSFRMPRVLGRKTGTHQRTRWRIPSMRTLRDRGARETAAYDDYLRAATAVVPSPPPDWQASPFVTIPDWRVFGVPREGGLVAPPGSPRLCARRAAINGGLPDWAQRELGAPTVDDVIEALFGQA